MFKDPVKARPTGLRLFSHAGALVAALMTVSAAAHHSYSSFEMDKTISIAGTVSKWEWTNPHSFLYIDAPGAGGAVTHWRIECTSPIMLARAGFTRNSFQIGDKVTITAHPTRESLEDQLAEFMSAKWADGHELSMGGPRSGGDGGQGSTAAGVAPATLGRGS